MPKQFNPNQQVYYLTGAGQDSISEKTWCCPTLWGIQYQITILILKRFTYEPTSYTKFHSVTNLNTVNPMLALFILSDFSNFLFHLFNCCNQLSLIGLKKRRLFCSFCKQEKPSFLQGPAAIVLIFESKKKSRIFFELPLNLFFENKKKKTKNVYKEQT